MKQKIVNYLLRHLVNSIVTDDVISQDNTKKIFLDGKPVNSERIKQWQAEIKAIEGSDIWKCTVGTLKFQAQDKVFNKSLNFEDVTYGKSMLYNLSLINSIFTVVKNKRL